MKAISHARARIFCALALVAICSAFASVSAQSSRDLRVVSARAGGVNYVFGDVKFRRADKDVWQKLSTATNLDTGDAVKTGTTGLVEVLLNPGSYLRLGVNSEFELADASLDDLRVKLVRGSAVIEATGFDQHSVLFRVETPQTQVAILRTGIYRINALPSGETEVVVRKGRALVGRNEQTALLVKEGKIVHVGRSGATEVAKLDKKTRDELDVWSKERGEELAAANRRLTPRQATSLIASLDTLSSYDPRYYGVWYYDPRRSCHTFLPFAMGWRSPYGGYYESVLLGWPCYSCRGSNGGWANLNGGYKAPGGNGGGSSGNGGFGNGKISGGSGINVGGGPRMDPQPQPQPQPVSAPREMPAAPVMHKVSPHVDP